jgi:predicted GIY-YIG superfamily endonuclease
MWDGWNYILRGHNGEIVYKGITNDPDAREREHREDGKRFRHLETVGNSKSWSEARRDEKRALWRHYEREGRQPRYNKRWWG